ncbi:MAG: MlaD family protein [Aquabacterium sp.]
MKRPGFWVGTFVLAAVALIVAGILAVGQTGLFSRQHVAVVYFDGSVKGLYLGAPVSFRGVKIGEVTRIGLEVDARSLDTRIPVEVTLQSGTALRIQSDQDEGDLDIANLVQRGLRARLSLQSFVTGQMGVELDFRPDTPLTLLGGTQGKLPEIPTTQDKLDALIAQVQDLPVADLMAKLLRTLDTLDQTLLVTQRTLQSSGREINATAAQTRATLGTVSEVLKDVRTQTQTTLVSVQTLAEASTATVRQAQPDIAQTLLRTRQAADAAQLAMNRIAELSAPGAPMRADLESALADLSQTSRSLRSFADQLDRHPSTLLFGGKAP